MKQQYFDELQKNFEGPRLNIRWRGKGEGFHSSYASGTLTLEAESLLAAIYGINALSIGVASGHLAEFLGKRAPRFPLRPLWLQGWKQCRERDCRRIIALGYNAVLFPWDEGETVRETFLMFSEFGLKVLVQPTSFNPKNFLDPHEKKRLQQCVLSLQETLPQMDYLFWEGIAPTINREVNTKDFLQADLALLEVRMLEEVLSDHCSLIYYLPYSDYPAVHHQTAWFTNFCNDVGPKTIISFSAVAGNPTLDHLPLHPFWSMLRCFPDVLYTPLLPIVNLGSLGEGFWPALPLDSIECSISRCSRHYFAGILSLVKHLPEPGAFLECTLWTASQMLWTKHSASFLAEIWFAAFRPDLDFLAIEHVLRQSARIAQQLSALRFQEGDFRVIAESIIEQLNEIEHTLNTPEKRRPSLHDYATYFVRDARRIAMHALQSYPIVKRLHSDHDKKSFWTEMREGSVVFLDTFHQIDCEEEIMEQIYCEVVGEREKNRLVKK